MHACAVYRCWTQKITSHCAASAKHLCIIILVTQVAWHQNCVSPESRHVTHQNVTLCVTEGMNIPSGKKY